MVAIAAIGQGRNLRAASVAQKRPGHDTRALVCRSAVRHCFSRFVDGCTPRPSAPVGVLEVRRVADYEPVVAAPPSPANSRHTALMETFDLIVLGSGPAGQRQI